MKKLYSTIMTLAMMLALCSSTCSGGSDDDDVVNGGGENTGTSSLWLTTSNDVKYVLLTYHQVFANEGDNVNGNLTDNATIYWYMTPQTSWWPEYVYILLDSNMSISDFPTGYDLGERKINFGLLKSENKYKYSSGSIKVLNNDGNSFTLEFNDYTASKSSGASITLNGTLYVEKHRLF